jgi:hypothetical protein
MRHSIKTIQTLLSLPSLKTRGPFFLCLHCHFWDKSGWWGPTGSPKLHLGFQQDTEKILCIQ